MIALRYRGSIWPLVAPLIALVALLGLWQLTAPLPELPPPSQILAAFFAAHQRLLDDAVATFWEEALRGYLLGCLSAFLFAALCMRFRVVQRAIMPYAIISNSIPIIAFAPVVIFWFGFGWQSKAIVVVMLTFFPMLVNTLTGLNSYDPLGRDLLHSYGAGAWTVFTRLQLPSALPYIFNGLKICTTLSMIGAVVAEYFPGPNRGLGFEILDQANQAAWDQVWAGVILACLFGIGFYVLVLLIERRLTFWHTSYRSGR